MIKFGFTIDVPSKGFDVLFEILNPLTDVFSILAPQLKQKNLSSSN